MKLHLKDNMFKYNDPERDYGIMVRNINNYSLISSFNEWINFNRADSKIKKK